MSFRHAFVLLLLLCVTALGGEVSRVRGTVRDGSHALVPGTLISCVEEETGFRFASASNDVGEYELAVPPGHYNLVARRQGFRAVARMGVAVAAGSVSQVDFHLEPGSVTEVVIVENSLSPRPLSDDDGSAVVRPEDLQGAPSNDRTVTGLLRLAPGILITPASSGEPGQFSSLGARPNDNSFTVDGISANNSVGGAGWPSFLPGAKLPAMTALGTTHALAAVDAIETVSVQPQAYTAQSGYAPGANVAIQTRAGTEQFHGSAFVSARPSQFGSNDWFANRYGLGSTAPSLFNGAATVGGPVHHASTYFFASFETLRLRQTSTWQTTVPSLTSRELAPPGLAELLNEFPLPNGPNLSFGMALLVGSVRRPAGLNTGSLRLDQALSPSTRAFLRLAYTPSSLQSGWDQVNLSSYRTSVAVLGLNSEANRWTNETRLGFNRTQAVSRWLGQTPADSSGLLYSPTASSDAALSGVTVSGAGSIATGEEGRNRQDQFQFSHTASHQIARHTLKAGVEYRQRRLNRMGPTANTNVTVGTSSDPYASTPAPVWVTVSEFRASRIRLQELSGFVQDTWSLAARLNLTVGARWLWPRAPQAGPGDPLYSVDDANGVIGFAPLSAASPLWHGPTALLDPKIALALRPFAHADTVLRASWGAFHDPAFAVATDSLNGAPTMLLESPNGFSSPQLVTVRLGSGVASDLRVPVSYRWNFSLQQSWHRRDWFAVSYSALAGRDLLRREVAWNPSPDLGQLAFATNQGRSDYASLNLGYKRSLSRGLNATASYAWSRSTDLGSTDAELFLIGPGRTPATDRGPSDFDVRHNLNGAISYAVARSAALGRFASVAAGWTFGTFLSARSGFPIDVISSENIPGFAVSNLRPSLVHGAPLWVPDSAAPGGRYLNSNAFLAFPYAIGNLPRNAIRGAGMWQLDCASERAFRFGDSLRLQFRAEAYNLANHPRFADPVRFLSNPLFGQSSSPLDLMYGSGSPSSGQSPPFQMGGARSMQLSLRLSF
jgi:hypothetical protein